MSVRPLDNHLWRKHRGTSIVTGRMCLTHRNLNSKYLFATTRRHQNRAPVLVNRLKRPNVWSEASQCRME
jgi:hypothetical protein